MIYKNIIYYCINILIKKYHNVRLTKYLHNRNSNYENIALKFYSTLLKSIN